MLIFHKGGQYSLDIAGKGDTPAVFSSLDDLVVFCMSRQMRMEGDEVRAAIQCSPTTYMNAYIVRTYVRCSVSTIAEELFGVMRAVFRWILNPQNSICSNAYSTLRTVSLYV